MIFCFLQAVTTQRDFVGRLFSILSAQAAVMTKLESSRGSDYSSTQIVLYISVMVVIEGGRLKMLILTCSIQGHPHSRAAGHFSEQPHLSFFNINVVSKYL